MSEKQFEGRSAIVTGATRGIGKAIAKELARRGCNVAFNYSKSAEEAEKLAAELQSDGAKIFSAQCDVASTAAAADFVGQVKEAFGTVDYLINNAGITRDQLILRMKEEDWDSVIDTNLKGAWNFSKAVLRPMLRNENGGSILNISSVSGVVGMLGQSNYSASKAGMIGLTKALAKEVASKKITVNALATHSTPRTRSARCAARMVGVARSNTAPHSGVPMYPAAAMNALATRPASLLPYARPLVSR